MVLPSACLSHCKTTWTNLHAGLRDSLTSSHPPLTSLISALHAYEHQRVSLTHEGSGSVEEKGEVEGEPFSLVPTSTAKQVDWELSSNVPPFPFLCGNKVLRSHPGNLAP